jgi:two-component system nitrogen regulation response regulator NtrX
MTKFVQKKIEGATILVIVYEHIVRRILTRILTTKGHNVVARSMGYKGIKTFEKGKGKYDLVMIDIRLPDIDCLSVAKRIKKTGRKTPVMLINKVWGKAIDTKTLKESGVDFIVRVPFHMDKTLLFVENALAKVHQ